MVKQTTYTDSTGQKKTGYIKDGVTYTDSSLTSRVGNGAVVETAGGTYYKGSEKDYGVKINTPSSSNQDTYNLYGKSYQTHFNDRGEAFMDEGKTTRLPYGTTFTKNGAQYYNHKDLGAVPTMGGVMQNLQNQSAETESWIRSAYEAQTAASQARTDQKIRGLSSRADEIAKEKEKADRLSYNAYIQAINPYGARAQTTARLGLSNSGFSETSLTSLGNTYQMALAGNEEARANAMRDLTILIDQARTEGDRELYDICANMYTTLYNSRMENARIEAELGVKSATLLAEEQARDEEYAREDAALSRAESAEDEKTLNDTLYLVAKYVLAGELTVTQAAKMLGIAPEKLQALLAGVMYA